MTVTALAVGAGALGLSAFVLGRLRTVASQPLMPKEFVDAANAQADAMRLMAERTADGLRAANGTYVFALRDRFDEALPALQLGVADTSWAALGDAPGSVEELVFHPNDVIRFRARVVCNQASGRRLLTVEWADASGLTLAEPSILTVSGRVIPTEAGELPSDTTAFLEFPVDLTITEADLAGQALDRTASVNLTVTDHRPEGSVVKHTIDLRVRGYLQPDDDGVAIELPAIEVTIGPEARRWYLDKASELALALPGQAAE